MALFSGQSNASQTMGQPRKSSATMLSDEYGFSYSPGHIVNGDFVDGLQNWKAVGNVTTGKMDEYAHKSQDRWSAPRGVGDTFAILTKEGDETSSVSQIAKGFTLGRYYCLQFAVVDYNELKEGQNPCATWVS